MSRSDDRIMAVGTMVAVLVAILVVFSACTAGTGPDYKGPGIEIDVDHHTKKPSVKKKTGGSFGGSSSRYTKRK